MVACSRARASWRAIVSRPELTLASWAIRLARSTWVDAIGDGSSMTGGSVWVVAESMALAVSSSASGGPGGRLSRSSTVASSAKLLRVIEPLVPLLFLPLLDEDIVVLPEMGTAVTRQENPCRVTASGFTMPIGWTALTVQPMGDDQGFTSSDRCEGRGD